MKVTINGGDRRVVHVSNMKWREAGVIEDSCFAQGSVVIKNALGVSTLDGNWSWNKPNFQVRLLPKGTVITLEVE